jgi:translation initiation factor 2 alpha subunit (eIF-2alpha)
VSTKRKVSTFAWAFCFTSNVNSFTLDNLHITGYIDLSKRRVDPEDVVKCEERYNKAKAVHSVLTHVAKTHNMPVEELCKKVGWPLYRKFGHAYDAFKIALK